MSLISIATEDVVAYRGDLTPATARFYASVDFRTSGGVLIAAGSPADNGFYQSLTASMNGVNIRITGGNIYATTTSTDHPEVTYLLVITDVNGVELWRHPLALRISATTNTFLAIEALSQTAVVKYAPRYQDDAAINARLAALVNVSTLATEVTRGGVKLTYPSINPADPKVLSDGDPRVSGVLASYTKAALPVASTGQMARVTDSTRGVWRYDSPLAQWIPTDGGRRINALDFCNPVTNSDCSAGLQAAIDVLRSLGGGTLEFPAGYNFQFASTLVLSPSPNRADGIVFEGSIKGTDRTIANLTYTGAGDAGIDARSSFGTTIKNLTIQYTNAAFTGWLVKFGHNASGADAQRMTIIDSTLTGKYDINPALSAVNGNLLDLNLSIIGNTSRNHFLYAQKGIRGVDTVAPFTFAPANVSTVNDTIVIGTHTLLTGDAVTVATTGTLPVPLAVGTRYIIVVNSTTIKLATTKANAYALIAIDLTTAGVGNSTLQNGGYAYVHQILDNTWNYVQTQIWNADSLWNITGNTFEPDASGRVVAFDSSGVHYIRALTFNSNYTGDGGSAIQAQCVFRRVLGGTIAGNWFTVVGGAAAEFVGSNSVDISGNRVESISGTTTGFFLNGVSETNVGITLETNSMNVTLGNTITFAGTNQYKTDHNTASGGILDNVSTLAMAFGNGFSSAVDASLPGFANTIIGDALAVTTGKIGAAIRRVQSSFAGGYSTGGLIIQSRTDSDSTEISFVNGSAANCQMRITPIAVDVTVPIVPRTNDAAALGSATLNFSDLFLATGAVLNYANGNVAVTHSAGILTMGTGELRVTTPGTNAASVPTLGSTSTFTNKTLTSPVINGGTGTSLAMTGAITSSGTAGIGYSAGAGGAVTQLTSRTTNVTLDKTTGAITLLSAAGSATPSSFTVNNNTVGINDTIIVNQKSGADIYIILVTAIAAGSFRITSYTTGGVTVEAPVFSFTVIKGVIS